MRFLQATLYSTVWTKSLISYNKLYIDAGDFLCWQNTGKNFCFSNFHDFIIYLFLFWPHRQGTCIMHNSKRQSEHCWFSTDFKGNIVNILPASLSVVVFCRYSIAGWDISLLFLVCNQGVEIYLIFICICCKEHIWLTTCFIFEDMN